MVLGFPSFQITIEVDEAASEARMAQYLARKQEQDEMLVKQAEEAIKQNQQDRQRSDGSQSKGSNNGPLLIGRQISSKEEIKQMASITEEERSVVIEGYIFDSEIRELRSGRKLLVFKMTDYTSSFSVKLFSSNETDEQNFELVKKGIWVRVRGSVQEDTFMRDLVVNGRDVNEVAHAERKDRAPEDEKRVELHLHSNMSQMDATNGIGDFVKQAAKWGHKAIALTDHAAAQGYPDAHAAGKANNVKILYGIEAYVVDDGVPIAYNPVHEDL
ncbi:MAG TPA: PHP domain-containing protein, partial [Trichococcus flocculiformis]|nr:PHP domain-containing protein [Trichococcus flocculiformis]